ncbi:hypothetical protein, partial [Pseudomonas sp. FG-3G]
CSAERDYRGSVSQQRMGCRPRFHCCTANRGGFVIHRGARAA